MVVRPFLVNREKTGSNIHGLTVSKYLNYECRHLEVFMRFLPVLFVLCVFAVGCNDSGGGIGAGGGEDMAIAPVADMTQEVTPPDLAMTAPKALGCAGLIQC